MLSLKHPFKYNNNNNNLKKKHYTTKILRIHSDKTKKHNGVHISIHIPSVTHA